MKLTCPTKLNNALKNRLEKTIERFICDCCSSKRSKEMKNEIINDLKENLELEYLQSKPDELE